MDNETVGQYPPAQPEPRWGPSRVLRLCTGVHEKTLALVPSERPRYTAMGGVVAGTATIAMLSMAVALYSVFGGIRPFVFFAVPIWGLFILSLDRWLMSTTSVEHLGEAAGKLLPRLLLSIALGVVLAEPLLLGVYNTAIEERVAKERADELVTRGSDLRMCNPVPGTIEATQPEARDPRCADLRFPVSGDSASPEALQTQLDSTKAQAEQQRPLVKADADAYAALEEKSRLECNGNSGPGLTGRRGVGLNCNRLRTEASQYRLDHRIDENNARLATLDDQVRTLTDRLGTARTAYAAQVNDAIEADLAAVRGRQRDVGLLERFRTLDTLVRENGYVRATQWALRIFFIVVDALPVLLKVLNGRTVYDRMLARQLADRERGERLRAAAELDREAKQADLVRLRTSGWHEVGRKLIGQDVRVYSANLDEARNTLINAKERHLLRTALGRGPARWDPETTQELVVDHESPRE